MYPVSATYLAAIAADTRESSIAGTITLLDDTTIYLTDEDIVQGSLYISEQSVSGEDLDIGSVYVSEMGMSLIKPLDNPYALDGARIALSFGIVTGLDEEGEQEWEQVPLGYYYVTEIKRTQSTVEIKALDGMIRLDVDLSGVVHGGTPHALLASLAAKGGLVLSNTPMDIASLPNGNIGITVPVEDTSITTCRDLLMWICQLMGVFARINRMGHLEVVSHGGDGSTARTIPSNNRYRTKVSDYWVKITRVATKTGDVDYIVGEDGMTMTLESNPLLEDKTEAEINAILENILSSITAVEYAPHETELIGDPALQPGDYVTLSDTGQLDESDITTLITHSSWRYRGRHMLRGAGKSTMLKGVYSQQAKTIAAIQTVALFAQTLATTANQSAQLINDAIGGNILIRQSPEDATNEILIMDSANPAAATKIWRWNMGGLGYSDNVTGADNPSREYRVAMTMDGQIYADRVSGAIGTFFDLIAGEPSAQHMHLGSNEFNHPFFRMYENSGDLGFDLGIYNNRVGASWPGHATIAPYAVGNLRGIGFFVE